jgi:membrane-associated protease RseP (regulator of RpoE activity)
MTHQGGSTMTARRTIRGVLAAILWAPLLFAAEPASAPVAKAPARTDQPQADKVPAPKAEPGKSEEKRCPYSTQECLGMMATRMKASGWIGIEYEPADGPKVTRVVPGSPAEKAGLQPGDILYALNGVVIRSDNETALAKARKEWKPGQKITYTIKRDGVEKQVDVVLGEWPADLLARYIGEHMLQHAEWDAEDAAKKQAPPK